MAHSEYAEEYLRIIKDTIDPDAAIDSDGNVTYVDDGPYHLEGEDPVVVSVSPEECYKILNEMCGLEG